MRIFHLIIFLLIVNCSQNSNNDSNMCQENGDIDFLYLKNTCESCVPFIENMLSENDNIFDYNLIVSANQSILINFCYNRKIITPTDIETLFKENGFNTNFHNDVLTSIQAPDCCKL